jgi:hypothetical protein
MLLPRNSSTDVAVLDLQDDVIQIHGSLWLAGKVIAHKKVLAMWIGTDFLEHINPILLFLGARKTKYCMYCTMFCVALDESNLDYERQRYRW